jgi:hypothetical protein
MARTILHCSDSLAFATESDGESAVDLGSLDVVVRRAVDRDVDAVVHTGNLFRSPAPDERTVEAIREQLAPLAEESIPFYLVAGTRGSTGSGDALEGLRDGETVRRLSNAPTTIGDVTLYGIDHVESEQALREALDRLEPAESYTYNVVALHQRIWPPLAQSDAEISAFDAMEATDVFVDEILAGGADEPGDWEHEDFDYRVSYAGSTNPDVREDGPPTAILLTAGADEHEHREIPLTRTTAADEIDHLRAALDHEPADLGGADLETLADLYGLAARASDHFDDRRREIREEILDRVHQDTQIRGEYATVTRTTSRRRVPKDERAVFEALRRAGVNPYDVLELDSSALRELSESGAIEDEDVFDREERTYVRVSDTEG